MVLIKVRLQEQIEVIRKVPFCSLMHTELPLCLQVKQFTKQLFAFFAIATFFSCDQCNRSSNGQCLPSVTTWHTHGTSFLSVKQETQWLWPMPLKMCHSEGKTTPGTKFCSSRKLVFHLCFKYVWLKIGFKGKKKRWRKKLAPKKIINKQKVIYSMWYLKLKIHKPSPLLPDKEKNNKTPKHQKTTPRKEKQTRMAVNCLFQVKGSSESKDAKTGS